MLSLVRALKWCVLIHGAPLASPTDGSPKIGEEGARYHAFHDRFEIFDMNFTSISLIAALISASVCQLSAGFGQSG